ncbi:MAG: hypothetical protein BMS9Abin13_599 [Patescibacteria group bacterium]|nr:MAG: hypothetical protein BMS9Abin13_599 [Patescibacteria group bacterium]
MNYRLNKRPLGSISGRESARFKKRLLLTVVFVVLLYILLLTPVFGVISKGVGYVAVPAWKAGDRARDVWQQAQMFFAAKNALIAENRRLKKDIYTTSFKLLDRNLLFEENLELKEILGREAFPQTTLAAVLAGPGRSLYDTLIIDVGENMGVQKGDRVLHEGSVVIGEVSEVYPTSSKVKLFSSPGEATQVSLGEENIFTVAYGRGGGNFEVKLPRGSEIREGDVIIIPGITKQVLGVVEYIETKASDPFKRIIFKGPAPVFNLKWVEVLAGTGMDQ